MKVLKCFKDVAVSQNFQFWSKNGPVWARKTSMSGFAVSKDDVQHVFYPNDAIMAIGNKVHGLDLARIQGNPQVVLLESDTYWEQMTLNDAILKTAKNKQCSWTTTAFIIRKGAK